MKTALLIVSLFIGFATLGQRATTAEEFQRDLNKEYKDPKKSPLEPKARKRFKGHNFFPIDARFRVEAELNLTESTPFFQMKTTTDRLPRYRKYGYLSFSIDGIDYQLPVYQSQDLMRMQGYEGYLFLPFTDLTNGSESYSGGRYLELRVPKEGNTVLVDFNMAYNPYCAYNHNYSCPVVPPENHIDTHVRAGVRFSKK